MSTVLILTPIIIGSWPAITAAVAGAAVAMGLAAKETVEEMVEVENEVENEQHVEVELEQSQVLSQSMKTGQEIVLTSQEGIEIRVGRDARGQCIVCAKGHGFSKTQLKKVAEEFTEKLTQSFVYNRVVSELKDKNFQVIDEEIMEDESVRIHVRRWVD